MTSFRFFAEVVFIGNSFDEIHENETDTIVLASSSRFGSCTFRPWSVNFKVSPQVRSGQGQVMTQVGQYVYLPKRLNEPSRLAPFARLFLRPVASYWRNMDCDVTWPQLTIPWPPIIGCTRIITIGVSGHNPERIGWFRSVCAKREAFSYFLIDL